MSAPTSRTGVSFHASPLLIGSGIAAAASTILMAVVWYFDARNPPPRPTPGGSGPPPPPPEHITFQVLLALCVITWLAVLVAVCRDQLMRRINVATQEIIAATSEYGERRETEGYLKARRAEPPPTGPSGGDVVPFPRHPDR